MSARKSTITRTIANTTAMRWCFEADAVDYDFPALRRWARKLYYNAGKRARKRGMAFTLTRDEFVQMMAQTEGRCELSGMRFSLARPTKGSRRPYAPSLDRIDPGQGYAWENCRIVCAALNYGMSDWGFEPLLRMAKGIVDLNPEPEIPHSVGPLGARVRLYRRGDCDNVHISFTRDGKEHRRSLGSGNVQLALAVAKRLSEKLEHRRPSYVEDRCDAE